MANYGGLNWSEIEFYLTARDEYTETADMELTEKVNRYRTADGPELDPLDLV